MTRRRRGDEPPIRTEIGVDGWPVEDNRKGPALTQEDHAERQRWVRLNGLRRAHEAGSLTALKDLVEYCGQNDIPLPDWSIEPISVRLDPTRPPERRMGRHSNSATQVEEDATHAARWDLVQIILDQKTEFDVENLEQAIAKAAELFFFASRRRLLGAPIASSKRPSAMARAPAFWGRKVADFPA